MLFALMQVKTGLCHILSRFEVAPCKEMPVPIAFFFTVGGELPLTLKSVQL